MRAGDKYVVPNWTEVEWIEAVDNDVSLHVGGREFLLRDTLAWIEPQLDPEQFVRIHRSAIVQLDRIVEVRPATHGDDQLTLRTARASSCRGRGANGSSGCARSDRSQTFDPGRPMTDTNYWLTTERLGLRRFIEADFDWFAALYADADVTRHLGGVKSRSDARAFFDARILRYYEAHPGLGMWMTIQLSDEQPIGFHLLNHIRGESIVQVGFTIAKAAWGMGYATEMAEAVLRYGFVDVRLPRVAGMANRDNLASQRVLAKIGLERRGERAFAHPDYASAGPMAWFEREAEAWLRSAGR